MTGIFIVDGMTVQIRNLSISLDEEGNFSATGPEIGVSYDACIAWAKIALAHRDSARERMSKRRDVWNSDVQEADKSRVLEEEFAATMQAVVAAATCIDALYDQIVRFSPISAETRASWMKKRTARYVQVAETLRATFRIKPEGMKQVISTLRPMYRLRDASVHPSSYVHLPYRHPELDIATDWRLTTFRGDVADMFVCAAVGLLWDITRGTKYRSEELTKFIEGFRAKIERILPEGKPEPALKTVTFDIPPRTNARGFQNSENG